MGIFPEIYPGKGSPVACGSITRAGRNKSMNEKKIAFIICVNDMRAYTECKYYLDHLRVPEGYETDVISIAEAPSMTAGYNVGMLSTDAGYKVYMHQDVLIVNPDFIRDMLRVFAADERIALMGMIGAGHIGNDAKQVMDWDTGKILHNCSPSRLEYRMENTLCQEVEAVDGLLLATRCDVQWREDLFDGWDYYDISQCMEFLRRGKKIVVPYQEEPWVWHDNLYSKMGRYYHYAELFAEEYSDIRAFVNTPVPENVREYHDLKEKIRKELFTLVDCGKRRELTALFRDPVNRGYLHLKEFQIIADIEYLENENNTQKRLWEKSDTAATLLEKVREAKFLLKRAEFGLETASAVHEQLMRAYSSYAISVIRDAYSFR